MFFIGSLSIKQMLVLIIINIKLIIIYPRDCSIFLVDTIFRDAVTGV